MEPPPGTRQLLSRLQVGGLAAVLVALIGVGAVAVVRSDALEGEGEAVDVIAAATLTRGSTASQPPPVDLSAIGRITLTGCGGSQRATGWRLGDESIVTAAHVVGGASNGLVELGDGSLVQVAAPVVIGEPSDVALFVSSTPGRGLQLAATAPPVGSTVAVAGSTAVGGISVVVGEVVGVFGAAGYGLPGDELLVVDAPIDFGFSGGPVVGEDGRVVGVVAALEAGVGLALATPVDELWPLLESIGEPPAEPRC